MLQNWGTIVALIFASVGLVAESFAVEIIGHRGASADAPENTIPSLKLAYEQRADAAEIDVWISKDGRAVVIHDGDTKRTAGVERKVADQTLAELQQLDAGSWKGEKYAGTKIPTLEEALATIPAGKRLFVEIKCGTSGVPEVLRAIRAANLPAAATPVISFNSSVIAAVKQARPDLQAYWIVSLKSDSEHEIKVESLIAKAREIKADGLDLSDHPLLDKDFAQAIRDAKLQLYVWTVDKADSARRYVGLGVQGITTNKPGWLREQLQ